MSTSLKVVSMAAVFCASFSRLAMVCRSRVIRTRSSRSPIALGAAATCTGAGWAGASRASSTARASPLVIRPSLPEPGMVAGSSLFSVTIRWTEGASGIAGAAAGVGSGGGAGAAATGFGATGAAAAGFGVGVAGAEAPPVTRPRSSPGVTVAPSAAAISDRTPSSGATTSSETLSVSSSTSSSSFLTASPAFFAQRATVASVTDSPRVGVRISVIGIVLLDRTGSAGRLAPQAKASARKVFSSRLCRLISPAAVEADAGRPT